jgi:hypothetical protein
VNKGRKKINKCKHLKNEWNVAVSNGIVDMVIEKITALRI